jgi:hypothetical protein
MRMRGPNGEVGDVSGYFDKARRRPGYRLRRHGKFVGEYKTPAELAEHVDLAELVEEDGNGSS